MLLFATCVMHEVSNIAISLLETHKDNYAK